MPKLTAEQLDRVLQNAQSLGYANAQAQMLGAMMMAFAEAQAQGRSLPPELIEQLAAGGVLPPARTPIAQYPQAIAPTTQLQLPGYMPMPQLSGYAPQSVTVSDCQPTAQVYDDRTYSAPTILQPEVVPTHYPIDLDVGTPPPLQRSMGSLLKSVGLKLSGVVAVVALLAAGAKFAPKLMALTPAQVGPIHTSAPEHVSPPPSAEPAPIVEAPPAEAPLEGNLDQLLNPVAPVTP